MLFLTFITFGCFSVYSNITAGYCLTTAICQNTRFDLLSIINKLNHAEDLRGQNFALFICVVILFVFFLHVKYETQMVIKDCDSKVDSPSDYAIILRRLPQEVKKKEI